MASYLLVHHIFIDEMLNVRAADINLVSWTSEMYSLLILTYLLVYNNQFLCDIIELYVLNILIKDYRPLTLTIFQFY